MVIFERKGRKIKRRTLSDKFIDIANYIVLTFILLIAFYPLYFVAIASVSSPEEVYAGKVLFYPKDLTLLGYERVFSDKQILIGYKNSIIYACVGSSISVSLALTSAFALSRRNLVGRKTITFFFALTMFFSGGLIPTYFVVKNMGMLNTLWAVAIPGTVGMWHIIIARTFIQTTIPSELYESAVIDGCTNVRFFFSIVLPLSKPLIAVLFLFTAVRHWNSFFNALMYLRDEEKYPLQIVLRGILVSSVLSIDMVQDAEYQDLMEQLKEVVKYALIIVASVPLLVLYPFLQRYFVKGIMIGSIKG
jgi:putative aldouronate transport system permease protein